jgi:hypothetical protein
MVNRAYLISRANVSCLDNGIRVRSMLRLPSHGLRRRVWWGIICRVLVVFDVVFRWIWLAGSRILWVSIRVLIELANSFVYATCALQRTSERRKLDAIKSPTSKNRNATPSLASGAKDVNFAMSSSEGVMASRVQCESQGQWREAQQRRLKRREIIRVRRIEVRYLVVRQVAIPGE